jgi:methylmalonyl-CoA mutase C-terminal domain/subunit
MTRKIRVIVGKPGLDGHDRGAKVIASALRDAGMEVIYTGLRATPEQIVAAAIQESCDVIGLSVLSGAHETIAKKMFELMRARGVSIPLVVGGVIPPADRERLTALGVAAVYGQEATLPEIVAGVQRLAQQGGQP